MQRSFSDLEYASKKKVTRRERFLAEIDAITPWHEMVSRLAPSYPKGKRRALKPNRVGQLREQLEQAKARIRAKVEHPFHVIKNLFGHRKTRYRGLARNTTQLYTLFGLVMARRGLLA